MPKIKLYDSKGKASGEFSLSDELFSGMDSKTRKVDGEEITTDRNLMATMHQSVLAEQANSRQGTHKVKTRGEVRGGGRKPWKQKKTGRARQGSIRSPLWPGGGVTFGPTPRSYDQKMNRKARRLASRAALGSKIADGVVVAVDGIAFEQYKTKDAVAFLASVDAAGPRTLVVLAEHSPFAIRSFRNLPNVELRTAPDVSARDILVARRIVADKAALQKLEEVWSQ